MLVDNGSFYTSMQCFKLGVTLPLCTRYTVTQPTTCTDKLVIYQQLLLYWLCGVYSLTSSFFNVLQQLETKKRQYVVYKGA